MATRSQTETQITWSGFSTKSIAANDTMSYFDDFTFSSNLVDASVTVVGNSAGTATDDILEVYCARKKDPNNSNSGVPDTYDEDSYSYVGSIDCSSGNDTQRTFPLPMIMAGTIVRFGAKNGGTNAIVAGFRVTEDKLSY